MKKIVLLFTFLFTVSSSFIACRDKVEEAEPIPEYDTELEPIDDEVVVSRFGDYDLDDDGLWSSDEFGEAYDEDWTVWDVDADGYLDDNEFYTTYYGWVDTDDDNLISEDEWNVGYTYLYEDYAAIGDFGEYDLDDDGFLDDDEWLEGWGDSVWFKNYDLDDDGLVGNDEWDEGLFGLWDEDEDGFWDEDEYNTYSVYYDTW
ncbi:hypothetical protein [Salinimicrobium terrae]|uniref:hypothetical protein n=1 Tax=Salinimicrobium terrae TaxID=470866 RepID=UPI0004170179|nr:hypothetical protein [Salinimicrobium terrae]